jgi:hypothetical protein
MMLTPMISVLAHLLTFLVSILGSDLLIATFSLSFALALALDNISKLVIRLEMSLVSMERSQHGHNLLVTERFGSPISLSV